MLGCRPVHQILRIETPSGDVLELLRFPGEEQDFLVLVTDAAQGVCASAQLSRGDLRLLGLRVAFIDDPRRSW